MTIGVTGGGEVTPNDRFSSGEHWLKFGTIQAAQGGGINGCQCGFRADTDEGGFGDSVIDHIAAVATEPLRARLAAVAALAASWKYKGEFGWGPWQSGEGPDFEGQLLDQCATELLVALADMKEEDQ